MVAKLYVTLFIFINEFVITKNSLINAGQDMKQVIIKNIDGEDSLEVSLHFSCTYVYMSS